MLDTNIVSNLIRHPAGPAADRAKAAESDIRLSAIVAAELIYGCIKKGSSQLTAKVQAFLSEVPVLPFDRPADQAYGQIRAELEKAGQSIGANDLLIAAHAVALGATLVTANNREFDRVRGLRVVNWLVEPA